MLRKERYVTLSETVTITEDGYYALHGVLAANNSTVTLTSFASAALYVEGETIRLISADFRIGSCGKQIAYIGKHACICRRV